ncbi:hypothetical protein HDU98_000272, partial [Podochytrium sp. JEL0797]
MLEFTAASQSQHIHALRAKASASLVPTHNQTIHLILSTTLPDSSLHTFNNGIPIPVDIVEDESISKLGAGSSPSTLLLSTDLYASAGPSAKLFERTIHAQIVPSLSIPCIESIRLEYEFTDPLMLSTFPKDWVLHQLLNVVLGATQTKLALVTLDGKCVDATVVKWGPTGGAVSEAGRVAFGVVTNETRLILPCLTSGSVGDASGRTVHFDSRVFGVVGSRLDDLFQMYKLNLIDGLYGALVVGPTGTGKTTVINSLCKEHSVESHVVSLARLLSVPSKFQAKELFNIFDRAFSSGNSLIVLDKLELLFPKTASTQSSETNAEFHLILYQALDRIKQFSRSGTQKFLILGVTAYPERANWQILNSLFAEQIAMPQLTPTSRQLILETLIKQSTTPPIELPISAIRTIATDFCSNFTFADLTALWDYTLLTTPTPTPHDLESNATRINAQIRRTGDYGVEVLQQGRVEFSDVGGLEDVKELLMESLFWFHSRSGELEGLLVKASKGVLLYGPPGTGKTLLAKAIATETKANFLSVSISSIIKGFIGESEKQITNLFTQAKSTSPCILFLDEIESIFSSRENSGDFSQKILAQLVQEMDALSTGGGGDAKVVVLAATNYPALMDGTLLRPGRIDRLIAVRAPNLSQRESIFKVLSKKSLCADEIDWHAWARRVKGFSGAGITELFRKANLIALARVKAEGSEEEQGHLPLGFGPYEFEDHRSILEDSFLKPKNHFDNQTLNMAQKILPRQVDISNLLQSTVSKPQTTLKIERNLATLRVDSSQFREVLLENTDSNATNSTSFRREPSSHRDFVRGASTNIPFAPGGLENVVLKEDLVTQLAFDLDELLNLDSEGLKTVPPGFDRGMMFEEDSLHVPTYAQNTSLNIQDIMNSTSDDFGLFDTPMIPLDVPQQQSKQTEPPTRDAALSSLTTDLDHLIPTSDLVASAIAASKSAKKPKKETHKEWAYVVDVSQPFPDFYEKVPELAHQ